jgi:hypothetical protein
MESPTQGQEPGGIGVFSMGSKNDFPGFTAEASLAAPRAYYRCLSRTAGRWVGAVEPALMKLGAFECSGTCPAGQLLCKSDTNCVCCNYGCDTTPGGVAVCRSSPGRSLGGGLFQLPGTLGNATFTTFA